MSYEYSYLVEELLEPGLITGLLSGTPSFLLSVAAYVLTALGLYTAADRRGIRNAWLAWIPVVNVWMIGSLSDQYRYVVKGETRNKRKTLLILNLINLVLGIAMIVFLVLLVIALVRTEMYNYDENIALQEAIKAVIGLGSVSVIMIGTGIASAVVRYIAMYDIYMSMDPGNSVVYLVLSIIFNITEPFFLFFNRNNDKGMPPRREPSADLPPKEPWENTDTNI